MMLFTVQAKSRIMRYMEAELEATVDPLTGEPCRTTLAELAALEFDLYDKDSAVPEELFELADQVVEAWESDQEHQFIGRP